MNNKILKITIILVFTVLIVPFKTLKAQSEFGVKGGALYSGLKSNDNNMLFDFKKSSGFSIGAFYKKEYLFGPIGLQAELLYQMKGANIFIEQLGLSAPEPGENTGAGFSYYQNGAYFQSINPIYWDRHQEKYNYFSLPLLLTLSQIKFLDIYSGVELGYLFANSLSYSSSQNLSTLGSLNKFSASWIAGASLRLGESTKLDIRYSSNLTPLYEKNDTKLKDRSFSISVAQTLWRKQ